MLTASAVSAGLIWNTPKPSWGMVRPLFSMTSGTGFTTDLLRRGLIACCAYRSLLPAGRPFIRCNRADFGKASHGAWDSDMQGGPVDELLDVAVECPALDQLEVEVGRILEDRVQPGLTGDHREERHLHAVNQAGGHQRPVHRQAAVRAQRHPGLPL